MIDAVPYGDFIPIVFHFTIDEDGRPQLFVRAEDWTPYTPSFVVRTASDPDRLIPQVRQVVRPRRLFLGRSG